ncbi:HEAT repeat domain-containing protein [Streptomyces griseochromogenes]|uniref:HEAT repeat domain-containing protein n=1 Tax=Streptomyces griseochromogenes TaxID=68214 RepID=UPI0037BDBBF4
MSQKLSDPDRSVRNTAALAIGSQFETELADVLVEALWAELDFFVRETMTWSVTRLEEATRPAVLAAAAPDRSSEVRVQALHVLSKFANPETVDAVLPYITDADEEVARKARWALGRIQEPRAVPHLVALLGAHDLEVRNALTSDVAAFGAAAVPALVEALGSGDDVVRRHAADILCYIGHPDAETAAEALGAAVGDAESQVAMSALMALGELSGEVARQKIEAAREAEDPQVRGVAQRLATRKPRRSALRARKAG